MEDIGLQMCYPAFISMKFLLIGLNSKFKIVGLIAQNNCPLLCSHFPIQNSVLKTLCPIVDAI